MMQVLFLQYAFKKKKWIGVLCKIVLVSIHFLRQYSILGFSVNVQNMSLKLGLTL